MPHGSKSGSDPDFYAQRRFAPLALGAVLRFFECADRLSRSRDPEEQKRLKEELARMTFGE